jgi:L-ascorbate metabolism protein UlaG (beta-lactamase superfamily)
MRKGFGRLLVAVGVLGAVLAIGTPIVLSLPQFGARPAGERLARIRANPHWRDGAFVNPVPQAERSWADTWLLLRRSFSGDEVRVPPGPLPVVAVDAQALKNPPPATGLRAFWLGHASVYLEIDGVRVMADPMLSDHASPFALGPKRFHPPPIALADLPPIDVVVLTHDHYDHLDMPTVRALAAQGARFVVPLGIGAHLEAFGVPVGQVQELEWWQETTVRGLRVVCTPSRHYSGRGLTDVNATLWSSWSLVGPAHRAYVSGDTGWSDHFKAIGDRFGPFDMSFIKVGAYGPTQSWIDIHLPPEDAVRGHLDLRAKRLFPVHWSTFNLAFHDWDEPVKRTLAAARAGGVQVVTPRIGEIVDADREFTSTAWWEGVR